MKDDDPNNGAPLPWQMKVAGDLGAIKEGVGTLKKQVAVIQENMVKRTDCQAHMAEVRQQVQTAMQEATEATAAAEEASETAIKVENTAKTEIAKLRGRPVTGQDHPAVKPPSGQVAPIKPAAAGPPPGIWERMVKHSQGISAVVTMILLLGGVLLGLSHFIARLEASIRRNDDEQKQTQALIKQIAGQRLDAGQRPAK